MQKGQDIGHSVEIKQTQTKVGDHYSEDFVLEKSIFNNIFEKDIRRIFIYKKAERLAKAIHLITPAFAESVSLRNRIDAIAIGLVDAAILSIARTGGLLSSMNAELIAREAHILLQEVAAYEEPRLFLDDAPTLSNIAKNAISQGTLQGSAASKRVKQKHPNKNDKGHLKDRKEAILSVIKNKGRASIKDISTLIRGVSEKTIQRELLSLINDGIVLKHGERRWSTYSLTSD